MNTTQRFSRFTVLSKLGRGGTADVALAFDPILGRQAALKTPLADNSLDFPKLIQREWQLIGGYRFPGLVRLLDYDTGTSPYLLMEPCRGKTLDTLDPQTDLAAILNILSAAALDLEFLRAAGIIHGDLKPQNYFLPADLAVIRGDQLFYLKLSDFSLGRLEAEPETSRAGLGTIGYMAPETIREGRVSHRADLFAFGALAYQLITGVHPFLTNDPEPVRVNARIIEEQPTPIETLRPGVTEPLSSLVMALLAKSEQDRPATAWDVCRALEACGATYPFRKALLPKHLIKRTADYTGAVASSLRLKDEEPNRVRFLTEGTITNLRPLLAANIVRGTFTYNDGRFEASGPILHPGRLRRHVLRKFALSAPSAKRAALRRSVIESALPLNHRIARRSVQVDSLPKIAADLLLPLLRQKTIKRLAAKRAPQFERENNHTVAAHLYLKAGDLAAAERCAYQAACQLRNEHALGEALSLCQSVIRFAELKQDLFSIRALIMLKGDILKESGDRRQAQETYEQLVALYDGQMPDSLLGEVHKDLGDIAKMKQDFDSGIESLKRALAIFEQLGDRLEVSHVLNNMGNIYWIGSDLAKAKNYYRQALSIQRKLRAQHDIASTISNLAGIFVSTGDFKRSLRLFRLSLQLKEEIGNLSEIARTLNNLGYTSYLAGQMSQAVDFLKQSLERNRRTGNKHEILINIGNLALVTFAAGRLRQTLRFIDEGMALSHELHDRQNLAFFKSTLGDILSRMGRFAEAEQLFAEAQEILVELDEKRRIVEFSIQRAALRHRVGDLEQSAALASVALEEATAVNEVSLQLSAMVALSRYPEYAELEPRAFAAATELHLNRELAQLRFNRAERFLYIDQELGASDIDQLVADCEASDDNVELPAMCNLAAELLYRAGQIDRASALIEKSLRLSKQMEVVPEMAEAFCLRGQIESRKGAYESAYAYSRQALQLVKQIAENIDTDADRTLYMQKRWVQTMMAEIRRLGSLLGQKQRAGTNPALIQS